MTEKKCDHIIAFHIGHAELRKSERGARLKETCCGGVMMLKYCPECGTKLK